jgi:cholesterol transport system auxiliary component
MKPCKLNTFPVFRTAARTAARVAALGSLALLSACSVLPRAEPLDTYLLPPAHLSHSAAQTSLALSLRITRPLGGVQLAGQRIIVVPENNRLSVYKGVSWSDPAPVLLRDRILEAFRVDGRIAGLSTDEVRLQADYELVSDLQAFQTEYRDGVPEVVVRLDARLVYGNGRRIVASRLFESRHRPAGVEVPQVVASFGQASTTVASEMVEWVVAELGRCGAGGCAE